MYSTLYTHTCTGESCGSGTIKDLQSAVEMKGLMYSCYDVFGDPQDSSSVQDLSTCASKIITAEQQGDDAQTCGSCITTIICLHCD